MYTGKMIDYLIESVQRAEIDAHIYRDDELMEEFLPAHMLEASYGHEFAGVA
jgi:ribosomal protein S24E